MSAGFDVALDRAAEQARAWLASLPDRPVGVPADPAAVRAGLDVPLGDEGLDAGAVVDELATALEAGLVATPGPRYFGFVTGGALPAALGADWLTSAYDQNPSSWVLSPAVAEAERVAARWVLELLGLPAGASVGFVTGAQMANVAGLAAARHALLAAAGWDVGADGLAGAPVPTVVVGEQAHATLRQALRLLGFGADRARRVASDGAGRMRVDALRDVLADTSGPVLVCAQAGEVNTGAVDPLDAIADAVAAHGSGWLHVDGAFGLWAAASPRHRALVAGAERADSWAVDAHKWLNVPYDGGLAITRDPTAARAALAASAAYLAVHDRDPSSLTPESSHRARALPVYAALRSLGRRGVADLVDRCCDRARQAADLFAAHPGLTVLHEVVLNQVLLRVTGADTAVVLDRVQRDGTCWVGGTTWRGEPAIRFSVSNWSTTEEDITRSVAAITAAVDAG